MYTSHDSQQSLREGLAEYYALNPNLLDPEDMPAEATQQARAHRALCRRPAIALERLSLDPAGRVVLELRHPFRDGTTHLLFIPEDWRARLVALVPRPRAHLTRCVLASLGACSLPTAGCGRASCRLRTAVLRGSAVRAGDRTPPRRRTNRY